MSGTYLPAIPESIAHLPASCEHAGAVDRAPYSVSYYLVARSRSFQFLGRESPEAHTSGRVRAAQTA